MTNVLTNETPEKILTLTGVALFSMAFLFSVTVTDANFGGTVAPVQDTFSPERVVAAIDTTASSYSNFVAEYIIAPGASDYSVAYDNINWTLSNAKDGALAMLGLDQSGDNSQVAMVQVPVSGQVAGAETSEPYKTHHEGFGVNSLLAALGIE